MRSKKKPVVIVGGGPSGLMQALYLAKVRELPVVLVEQQDSLGGLYRSEQTPWGPVDRGVHILEQIGDKVFDELIFNTLPASDWNLLEGIRKDIAGHFNHGRLHLGSLYPDLRDLQAQDYLSCLGSILASAGGQASDLNSTENLAEYFETRFGKTTAEIVFAPIARKLWHKPLNELSSWAAKIVHLSRVLTHNNDVAIDLKVSPTLDSVIGFSDQMRVPDAFLSSHSRSLYPRQYGLVNFLVGLEKALNESGVEIFTSTKIDSLDISERRVANLGLGSPGCSTELAAASVIWTSPMPALLPLLNIEPLRLPDPPIPHRLVYLFLDKPPDMGELYWFWSYDPAYLMVRVSSAAAYCPQAADKGLYPLCVETHIPSDEMKEADVIEQVKNEVVSADLLAHGTNIIGSWMSPSCKGFVVPSVANCRVMAHALAQIKKVKPENLMLSTQDLSGGKFYLRDILGDSLSMLNQLSSE